MMKINLALVLTASCISSFATAEEDQAQFVYFSDAKAHRENYLEKQIEIEGQIKDLKVIKESGNKFATFFLTDASNPETISVKVNLAKRKTVINTFTCKNGDFTTVSGRFKPWGKASYLGKIEVRETYHFN